MKPQDFHLISHALCPYVQRAIITLEEKNISYTRSDIDLLNKPDWFQQISPMGKVPLLLIDDKTAIFESMVICEYLDDVTSGSLHPSDHFDKAYHRAWIELGSAILNTIAGLYNAKDEIRFEQLHNQLQEKFTFIEKELSDSPFFSGDTFHLIDAVYGPIFRYFDVFDRFITLNTFAHLPKCQQWRDALKHRRSVQQAVVSDYPSLLIKFLRNSPSYLSTLIPLEGANHENIKNCYATL